MASNAPGPIHWSRRRYGKICTIPAPSTATANRTPSGHGREGVVRVVQRPGRAVGIDDGDVLDPYAEAAGKIDARLDREGHSRLETLVISAYEVGMLVAVEADSVTRAVDEELAVSGVVDHAA